MNFCFNCGTRLVISSANFCPDCGQVLKMTPVSEMVNSDYRAENVPQSDSLAVMDDLKYTIDVLKPQIMMALADNPATPSEVLAELAKGEYEDDPGNFNGLVQRVARNPATPTEILSLLSNDENSQLDLLSNPSTPVDMVSMLANKLAANPDDEVRDMVACNVVTPSDVLTALASDESESVRWSVARNSATPPEVLNLLAQDDDEDVREVALAHIATQGPANTVTSHNRFKDYSSTPVETLRTQCLDEDEDVRLELAENLTMPAVVLVELAMRDPDICGGVVEHNLSERIDDLASLTLTQDSEVLRWAAGHPNMPADVLASLALGADEDLRRRLASNPSTPGDVLALLASDLLEDVRRRVAGNPSTQEEVLMKLAHDEREYVRNALASNSSITSGGMLEVIRALRDEQKMAEHPKTPASGLGLLSRSGNAKVRASVAANTNTPREVLSILSQDSVSTVRIASGANPIAPQELTVEVSACLACGVVLEGHSGKICRQCGLPTDLKPSSPKAPAEFEGIAAHASPTTIDLLLDAHEKCFRLEDCELCTDVNFGVGNLLEGLIANTEITASQQIRLLDAARNWDGMSTDFYYGMAANRAISDEIIQELLDDAYIKVEGLKSIYENMAENPRFSAADRASFFEDRSVYW